MNAKHWNLATFLTHAKLSGLSRTSTVYRGTVFEYLVQDALKPIARLVRVGGADDRGIDLRGQCIIDPALSVVVQCKSESRKLGPRVVREMEGAVAVESALTLGIVAGSCTSTEAAKRRMLASNRPLALCMVSLDETSLSLRQFVWNKAADHILRNVEMHIHYDGKSNQTIRFAKHTSS